MENRKYLQNILYIHTIFMRKSISYVDIIKYSGVYGPCLRVKVKWQKVLPVRPGKILHERDQQKALSPLKRPKGKLRPAKRKPVE
jgi:hypothetical protein